MPGAVGGVYSILPMLVLPAKFHFGIPFLFLGLPDVMNLSSFYDILVLFLSSYLALSYRTNFFKPEVRTIPMFLHPGEVRILVLF